MDCKNHFAGCKSGKKIFPKFETTFSKYNRIYNATVI